jgi:hypothetical protein
MNGDVDVKSFSQLLLATSIKHAKLLLFLLADIYPEEKITPGSIP